MNNIIRDHYNESLKTLIDIEKELPNIKKISDFLIAKINSGKKIFVYGNGGSFADSSHFVGELTATYSKKNRRPLPFILLSSNLAAITAWSNDFTYKDYVSRELDVFGSRGDVLILFSTSGGNIKKKQSLNLIKLANLSNKKNITVISLLGKGGGVLKKISSKSIVVNSNNTGSIQEMHKMIFHSICAYLDNHF
jgi:D-sedoheptulose 7-phosphate isomerase|tara:strand:- start:74 stop:655 length:582 start_codon:yes stop_codon:yes gene_type:complete